MKNSNYNSYSNKVSWFNKSDYALSTLQENIETVFYAAVCFFVPFLMGHPQLLVGIIVNASLVLCALNLKWYKTLPVIMLPSLGVLSKGLIFGPFTLFLLYIVPFIWLGNAILVFAIKKIRFSNKFKYNRSFALLIGAIMKTAFLFVSALVLVKLSILPTIFLTTMGLMQFYTALIGGGIAIGIQYAKNKIQN